MRNFMGSWRFAGGFILIMIVWALANSLMRGGWDPYPYILLNLFLSMLAGPQGAILLIAAKRQDAIAAALSQHDFDTNVAARGDIEVVLATIWKVLSPRKKGWTGGMIIGSVLSVLSVLSGVAAIVVIITGGIVLVQALEAVTAGHPSWTAG